MKARVLYGSRHSSLQEEAFRRAHEASDGGLESVLCVLRNDRRARAATEDWAEKYPRLELRTETFDSLVRDCREKLEGPAERLSGTVENRLVEAALTKTDRGPVDTSGLSGEIRDLFGLFENSGLTETEEVRERLEDSPVDEETADFVVGVHAEYGRAVNKVDESSRGETYDRVSGSERSFEKLFSNADVVVFTGFYDLQPLQMELMEWILDAADNNEEVSVVATLPLSHSPEEMFDEVGMNEGARVDSYREMGFEFERVDDENDTSDIAGKMYSVGKDAVKQDARETEGIGWHSLSTPEEEIRHVAREVRQELLEEEKKIGVVVPGIIEYQELLRDIFVSYDVPHTSVGMTAVEDTLVGSAVLDLLKLCRDRPRSSTLSSLLTNPIVELDTDALEIERVRRRTQRSDVESLVGNLEEGDREKVEDVLELAESLRRAEGRQTRGGSRDREWEEDEAGTEHAIDELRSALDDLGVTEERAESLGSVEEKALSRVESALGSLEETLEFYEEIPDATSILRNAVEGERIRTYSGTGEPVEVMGLLDARMRSFDSLYLVGVTSEHIPQRNRRTLFVRNVAEETPGVEYVEPRLQSRYVFTTLVGNSDEVVITTPETTLDDKHVLHSPVLNELSRVSGVEHEEVTDDRNASVEDLQRALPRDTSSDERLLRESDLPKETSEWALEGRKCAQRRSEPGFTEHDGIVEPETVESLYPESRRSPYSASRLDKYVSCGFKFYMSEVLGIETEEDFELGPTPLEGGSYVHEVLRRFYASLQDTPGTPVDLSEHGRNDLEQRVLDTALEVLEEEDFEYEDVFYERWLEQHLSGLGTPEEDTNEGTAGNPYYADGSKGLFASFLNEEYQRAQGADTKPAWFEAKFDRRPSEHTDELSGEPVAIELPSGEEIRVRGVADRIEINGDGSEAVVVDYKTGNYPNRSQIAEGTKFQLPLYVRVVEEVLDDSEMVDGTYYKVKPPDSVKRPRGLRNKFDDDDEYREFLREKLPRRLQEIDASVDRGYFNTTLLSSRAAGCRYCDYSDVCDVRHHMKKDVRESAVDEDIYVPERIAPDAREEEVEE